MQITLPLWNKVKRNLRALKEESEKADSKLNIQKTKSWHPVPSLPGKWMGKQWLQTEHNLKFNLHS